MNFSIRHMKPDEYAQCEQILRSLPNWFGIEDAIVNYVRDIKSMQTWVAESGDGCDGKIVGFLTLNRHNEHSAEVHVMAVTDAYHGQGCGRQLVEHAQAVVRAESVQFLQVKTLAPSSPDQYYARTRTFYERMGFKPLEENKLWGERNPCLILVKHLGCGKEQHQ